VPESSNASLVRMAPEILHQILRYLVPRCVAIKDGGLCLDCQFLDTFSDASIFRTLVKTHPVLARAALPALISPDATFFITCDGNSNLDKFFSRIGDRVRFIRRLWIVIEDDTTAQAQLEILIHAQEKGMRLETLNIWGRAELFKEFTAGSVTVQMVLQLRSLTSYDECFFGPDEKDIERVYEECPALIDRFEVLEDLVMFRTNPVYRKWSEEDLIALFQEVEYRHHSDVCWTPQDYFDFISTPVHTDPSLPPRTHAQLLQDWCDGDKDAVTDTDSDEEDLLISSRAATLSH